MYIYIYIHIHLYIYIYIYTNKAYHIIYMRGLWPRRPPASRGRPGRRSRRGRQRAPNSSKYKYNNNNNNNNDDATNNNIITIIINMNDHNSNNSSSNNNNIALHRPRDEFQDVDVERHRVSHVGPLHLWGNREGGVFKVV